MCCCLARWHFAVWCLCLWVCFTNHQATHYNLNMLWANPLYLLLPAINKTIIWKSIALLVLLLLLLFPRVFFRKVLMWLLYPFFYALLCGLPTELGLLKK